MKSMPTVSKDIFVLLGIAVSIWLIYFKTSFNGLKYPDAMYYASVARNMAQGHGMASDSTTPSQIALLKTNFFRPTFSAPLHPLGMSLFFYIFGVNDNAVALSSGLFYLLAVPVIYWLASELFGRKVGIVSALLYIINLELLNYSISGLTESLFIFLLLVTFLILYKYFSSKYLLLAGFALGLARLTRINAIIFILPLTAYIYLTCHNRKTANIMIFIFGFIVVSSPAMLRDYIIYNDPIFSGFHYCLMHFKHSSDTVGRSLLLADSVDFYTAVFSNLSGFIKNYLNNVHMYYVNFLGITKPLIMALFIVGFFRWYDNKKTNILKIVFLGSIVVQLLLLSVSRQPIRYFHVFIPIIIVLAAEYLVYLFEKLPLKTKASLYSARGLLFIFLCAPLFYSLGLAAYNKVNTDEKHQFYWVKDFLAKNTSPEDIVVCDYGGIGWYGNRKILWLPDSIKTMEEIDNKFLPVGAILLTSSGLLGKDQFIPLEEKYLKEWRELLDNPPDVFHKFKLVAKFDDGKMKAVLFKKISLID